MYAYLPDICRELRSEMMSIFWILLPLLVVTASCLETLKQAPDVKGVLHRSLLSVVLLLFFPFIFDSIASIGDGLSDKITRSADVWKVLADLKNKTMELNFDWLNLKSGIIFALNLLAYLVSYIGFFFTNAIIHFMWAILFVLSPLMILAIVFRETMGVTKSLFANLIKVMSWKVLFSLLGVLLIKFIEVDDLSFGDDNIITTIVINLCVGISMLFIPVFANSLFGNALSSFSTGMAMGATYPLANVVKSQARAIGSSAQQKAKTYTKRAVISTPKNLYQKSRNHFKEKSDAKRSIYYTGGIVPRKNKEKK